MFSYSLQREELLNLRRENLIQGAAYLGFALKIDSLLSPNTGLQINVQTFCDRWEISESSYYKSLRKLTKAGIVKVYHSSCTIYLEDFFADGLSNCPVTVEVDNQLYDRTVPLSNETVNCRDVQQVDDRIATVEVDNDCPIGESTVRSDSETVRSYREMIIKLKENGIGEGSENKAQSLVTEEVDDDSLARGRKIDMGEEYLSVKTDRYLNNINTNNNKININTNTCVRASAGANTAEGEKSQEVYEEKFVEVELIEINSTTPQRSEAITKTSSRVNSNLSLEVEIPPADENDNYYQTLPEDVREIAKKYDATQIAPKGIELSVWANYAIGSIVASYRSSGRILNSNPNDIDIEFINYMQRQGKKITNIHSWIRNMESSPSRWAELRQFVDGWIKEKFLSSDEGKEISRMYNESKGNTLFNSVE